MVRVDGKLDDGSSGRIGLEGNRLGVWEEKGFLSRNLVLVSEIDVDSVQSVDLDRSHSGNSKIAVRYADGDTEDVVDFYSRDLDGLEEIHMDLARIIDDRRKEVRRIRSAERNYYKLIRDSLTLIDQIYSSLFEINQEVDWDKLDKIRDGVKKTFYEIVGNQLETLPEVRHKDLAQSISNRDPSALKEIAYEQLRELYMFTSNIERLVDYDRTLTIDPSIYNSAVTSYVLLWDIELAEFLGEPVEGEELSLLEENLTGFMKKVNRGKLNEARSSFSKLKVLENRKPHLEKCRDMIKRNLKQSEIKLELSKRLNKN